MRFKAVSVLLGAVIASSFSTPITFGPAVSADAADAVPAPGPEATKVPEYVPVVNFGEFVLAMQTFAAQNPPAARLAAEALSAKFAVNFDAQQTEPQKPAEPAQLAQPAPMKPVSVIVTRPVAIAEIGTETEPAVQPPLVADPVKVITGYSVEHTDAAPRRRKAAKKDIEKKDTATSREQLEKQFQPAMGLGMELDSAEEAPPLSTLKPKKRKASAASQNAQ